MPPIRVRGPGSQRKEWSMPRLHVIEGPLKDRIFEFREEVVFIGRSARNDIQIKDRTISRKQVKLFRIGNNLFVEDLKSTNRTLVNGKSIHPGEGFEVRNGDVIALGSTVMRLEFQEGDPLAGAGHERDRQRKERRRNHSRGLELTYRVTELLRKSHGVPQICRETLAYLLEALPRIDRAAIILLDQDRRREEVFSRGRDVQAVDSPPPYSRMIVDRVIKEGRAIRMSNTTYEVPENLSDTVYRLKIRSVLCVSLISNSRVRGAIYLDSIRAPYGFRRADLLLLNSLSGQMAVAVENAALLSRLGGRNPEG
jgi:hypothetical protein